METVIDKNIEKAIALLKSGELVAIPTETVYGLAANALSEKAVIKIFEAKNRPFFDPLIVHTHSIEQVFKYVSFFDERLQKLAKKFWPGPLTLLLPKKEIIPDLVTSGLPEVGIRVPAQKNTLELLQQLDFPLAAPSANPFGYVSPTSAKHVFEQLQNKIPYILDGGNCKVGLESTIVGIKNNKVTIYRIGGLRLELVEQVVGQINLQIQQNDNPGAPGMLSAHYAPHKPVITGSIDALLKSYQHLKLGIISFTRKYPTFGINICLSEQGDLNEAGQNLFAALRSLDNSDVDVILAEIFPDEGLGKAINDRLYRASYKRK